MWSRMPKICFHVEFVAVSHVFSGIRLSTDSFCEILQVRKSMCRIKHVLTERAIEEPDLRRSAEMKRMINAL